MGIASRRNARVCATIQFDPVFIGCTKYRIQDRSFVRMCYLLESESNSQKRFFAALGKDLLDFSNRIQ